MRMTGNWYMFARKPDIMCGDRWWSIKRLMKNVAMYFPDTSGIHMTGSLQAQWVFKKRWMKWLSFLFTRTEYHIPVNIKTIGPTSAFMYPYSLQKASLFERFLYLLMDKKFFSEGRANYFIREFIKNNETGNRYCLVTNTPQFEGNDLVWVVSFRNPSDFSVEEKEFAVKLVNSLMKKYDFDEVVYPWEDITDVRRALV